MLTMANNVYIMQGAPGCGKSTFIHKNGLEQYVISPDTMREIINPNPLVYDKDTGEMVHGYDFSPRTSKIAFQMTNDVLEQRLRRGQTVILDLTASRRKTISKLLQTIHDYNYNVNYVNMQAGLDINEILRRNKERGIRAVPDTVIRKMYENVNKYEYMQDENVLTPGEMLEQIWIPVHTINKEKYVRIVCIGDIQGVYDRFKKSEAVTPRDDTLYVFTGDLLDRGTGAAEMFDWVIDHVDNDNIVIIRGNHDNYWRYYCNTATQSYYGKQTRLSIEDILKRSKHIGGNAKTLRHLAMRTERKFVDMYAVRTPDDHICVMTHGGLHPKMLDDAYNANKDAFRLGFQSEQDFYYGAGTTVDSGDYNTDIDNIIEKYDDDTIIQIHGHRNQFRHQPDDYTHVFNLEQHIEYPDGHLAMLTIDFNEGTASTHLIG